MLTEKYNHEKTFCEYLQMPLYNRIYTTELS